MGIIYQQLSKLYNELNSVANKDKIEWSRMKSFYISFVTIMCKDSPLQTNEKQLIADCCLLYVNCLFKMTEQLESINIHQMNVLKEYLKLIKDLSRINDDAKNWFMVHIAIPLLEFVSRPDAIMWFSKELLKNFKLVVMDSNLDLKDELVMNNAYNFFQLIDVLTAAGDFDYQMHLLETILIMFSDDLIKVYARHMFPECKATQQALCRIDRKNLFYESRKFLNVLNQKFKRVLSFKFQYAIIDQDQIYPPKNDYGDSALWADFNVGSKSLTIPCAQSSFSNDALSESDFELIEIPFDNIEMVKASKLKENNTDCVLLLFKLNNQRSIISSPRVTKDILELLVYDSADSIKLQHDILPSLFGNRFEIIAFMEEGSEKSSKREGINISFGKTNLITAKKTVFTYKPANAGETSDSDALQSLKSKLRGLIFTSDNFERSHVCKSSKIKSASQLVENEQQKESDLSRNPENESVVDSVNNTKSLDNLNFDLQKIIIPIPKKMLKNTVDTSTEHSFYNDFETMSSAVRINDSSLDKQEVSTFQFGPDLPKVAIPTPRKLLEMTQVYGSKNELKPANLRNVIQETRTQRNEAVLRSTIDKLKDYSKVPRGYDDKKLATKLLETPHTVFGPSENLKHTDVDPLQVCGDNLKRTVINSDSVIHEKISIGLRMIQEHEDMYDQSTESNFESNLEGTLFKDDNCNKSAGQNKTPKHHIQQFDAPDVPLGKISYCKDSNLLEEGEDCNILNFDVMSEVGRDTNESYLKSNDDSIIELYSKNLTDECDESLQLMQKQKLLNEKTDSNTSSTKSFVIELDVWKESEATNGTKDRLLLDKTTNVNNEDDYDFETVIIETSSQNMLSLRNNTDYVEKEPTSETHCNDGIILQDTAKENFVADALGSKVTTDTHEMAVNTGYITQDQIEIKLSDAHNKNGIEELPSTDHNLSVDGISTKSKVVNNIKQSNDSPKNKCRRRLQLKSTKNEKPLKCKDSFVMIESSAQKAVHQYILEHSMKRGSVDQVPEKGSDEHNATCKKAKSSVVFEASPAKPKSKSTDTKATSENKSNVIETTKRKLNRSDGTISTVFSGGSSRSAKKFKLYNPNKPVHLNIDMLKEQEISLINGNNFLPKNEVIPRISEDSARFPKIIQNDIVNEITKQRILEIDEHNSNAVSHCIESGSVGLEAKTDHVQRDNTANNQEPLDTALLKVDQKIDTEVAKQTKDCYNTSKAENQKKNTTFKNVVGSVLEKKSKLRKDGPYKYGKNKPNAKTLKKYAAYNKKGIALLESLCVPSKLNVSGVYKQEQKEKTLCTKKILNNALFNRKLKYKDKYNDSVLESVANSSYNWEDLDLNNILEMHSKIDQRLIKALKQGNSGKKQGSMMNVESLASEIIHQHYEMYSSLQDSLSNYKKGKKQDSKTNALFGLISDLNYLFKKCLMK